MAARAERGVNAKNLREIGVVDSRPLQCMAARAK